MKRFDEISHPSPKKSQSPRKENGEKKPGNSNIKTLDETKKSLGFQWNIPTQ